MQFPRLLNPRRRRRLCALVGLGIAQAGALALAAWLAKSSFEGLVLNQSQDFSVPAELLPVGLVLSYLLITGLRYQERILAERLGQGFVGAVRLALYDRLSQLPPRIVQNGPRGANLLRFIGDLSAIRQWVSHGLARLIVSGITLSLALLALALINPVMGAAISIVLCAAIVLSFWTGVHLRSHVAEARRQRSRLATNVDEILGAMATILSSGQVRRERRRLARRSKQLRRVMISKARSTARLRAIGDATNGLATVVVLMIAALQSGHDKGGSVIGAMTLLGLCLPLVRDLSRVYEYRQTYLVSYANIAAFMNNPQPTLALENHQLTRRRLHGDLAFIDIRAGRLFYNLNAQIAAGSKVVLTGPNGSGKSTLLALAGRLLDPDEGQVLLDNTNLRSISQGKLRRNIAMVSHDLPLIRGTLESNLRYRHPGVDTHTLQRISALCGVDEIIERSDQGWSQRILAGGANLSLGERTRVLLARALSGDPSVLLLDEIEAHLDARTRERLMAVIRSFPGTVLAVTHDPGLLAAFDHIWRLENGRIAQSTAHGPNVALINQLTTTGSHCDSGQLTSDVA